MVSRGHLGYPGIRDSYYSAIESWLRRISRWKVDAKACTATNVGIYTAVWTVLDALTKPGDEIIIQTPVHFCFQQILRDNGRAAVTRLVRETMPGVHVTPAEATYFAWLDFRSLAWDSDTLAAYFRKNAHVLLESGAKLGKGARDSCA